MKKFLAILLLFACYFSSAQDTIRIKAGAKLPSLTSLNYVDSIWREIGKDSIIFTIGGRRHAVKDSANLDKFVTAATFSGTMLTLTRSDGAAVTSTISVGAGSYSAANGNTMSGTTIEHGGALQHQTSLAKNGFSYNLTGAGGFYVTQNENSTNTASGIIDNNSVQFSGGKLLTSKIRSGVVGTGYNIFAGETDVPYAGLTANIHSADFSTLELQHGIYVQPDKIRFNTIGSTVSTTNIYFHGVMPTTSSNYTSLVRDNTTGQLKLATVSGGTVSVTNLSKGVNIQNPSSSESLPFYRTPVAISVTSAYVVVSGSSPSVTFAIHYGTYPTSSGTIVASNTKTASGSLTLNTTSIAANTDVWITTSATNGTVTNFFPQINYSQ